MPLRDKGNTASECVHKHRYAHRFNSCVWTVRPCLWPLFWSSLARWGPHECVPTNESLRLTSSVFSLSFSTGNFKFNKVRLCYLKERSWVFSVRQTHENECFSSHILCLKLKHQWKFLKQLLLNWTDLAHETQELLLMLKKFKKESTGFIPLHLLGVF